MQNYSGRKEARKPFLACMRGQRGGPCMRDTACWGHTVKSLGHKREPTAVSRSSWARFPVSSFTAEAFTECLLCARHSSRH